MSSLTDCINRTIENDDGTPYEEGTKQAMQFIEEDNTFALHPDFTEYLKLVLNLKDCRIKKAFKIWMQTAVHNIIVLYLHNKKNM